MKKNFKMSLAFLILSGVLYAQDFNADFNSKVDLPTPAMSSDKAIFGPNSMLDYYQAAPYLKKMADSTVAFVKKSDLQLDQTTGKYKVKKKMTMASLYADPKEDFYRQNLLSFCSGAYVGKGYILSAGHCISSDPKADNYFGNTYAVFGWRLNSDGSAVMEFSKDEVFSFTSVNIHELSPSIQSEDDLLNKYHDYSLSSLDREPNGKEPLMVEKTANVAVGNNVFTIGYPLGLAVKIDKPQDASVKIDGQTLFQTNIDAFGGNSGGPVFDSKTNKIVGILVTGFGGEFNYELKDDTAFYIVIDTTSSDALNIDPNTSTISVGKKVLPKLVSLLKQYDAKIGKVSDGKYVAMISKGTSIGNREPMFQLIVAINGVKVFNKGKLVRMEQDTYGTGIMKVPQSIKNLL